MPDMDRMHREWAAWRYLCDMLKARGIEINDDNQLARSIEVWGEELVVLRMSQTPDDRAKALYEKRRQLEKATEAALNE